MSKDIIWVMFLDDVCESIFDLIFPADFWRNWGMLGYQRGIVLFHQDIVLLGSIFVVNFLLDFHIVILVFFVFSVVLAQHCIDFVILMFVDVLATVEHF